MTRTEFGNLIVQHHAYRHSQKSNKKIDMSAGMIYYYSHVIVKEFDVTKSFNNFNLHAKTVHYCLKIY